MKRQYVAIIIFVAGILFLVGIGALAYGLSQGGNLPRLGGLAATPTPTSSFEIPDLEVTPPASLSEIAAEIRPAYPELANLLENPEVGSVYKDLYLAYQRGGEETALALARQRGILNDNDEVVMTLVLDNEDTEPLETELKAEGVVIQASFQNKINIAIPVSLIQEQVQAEKPDLIIERISSFEHVIRLEFPYKANIQQRIFQGQGVNVSLANNWQAQGITGQGVKVGVLDLGFGGYQDLLGTELPAEVTVEIFGDDINFETEVHGTACAEIIHEMAPEAELYFAYYDGTDVGFGLALEWLIEQDVDIISNSTGSSGLSPMDGSGFAADLVNLAHASGIFWVNSAGNDADVHYRGGYADADSNTLHEYLPDTEVLSFIPFGPGFETEIILSWDDWDNVDQDYDMFVMDDEGNIVAQSEEPQDGQVGEYPIEFIAYEFEDDEIYTIAIQNYEGQARGDATFDLFIHYGLMHPDFVVADFSLTNPADAQGAFAVGAVHWADDALEPYSSHGPTADGRLKPDLAAPSVVDSASYAPEAFDGTSAAAPHVSGAAALVLQAFPDFSPQEVAEFLQEQAIDLGPTGPDTAFGLGRLNLGEAPDIGLEPAEEPTPEPVIAVQPTSTPRPVPAEPVAGFPGEIDAGGEAGDSGVVTAGDEDTFVATLVTFGLCLTCVGGLLFLVLIVITVVVMRRR